MPYIRVNGIKIAYDTYGDMNKKPLFLVHGMGVQRMGFDEIIPGLTKDRFVICYDTRGHGQTTKPAAFNMDDHMNDLCGMIEAFGYEKADVFGLSMGSYITLYTLCHKPQYIDKAILCVSKAGDDGNGSSTARLLKEAGYEWGKAPMEVVIKVINDALFAPTTTPEQRAAFSAITGPNYVPLTAEDRAAANASMVGWNCKPYLKDIQQKVLVLSGKYDGINPPEIEGQPLADGIPNSSFVVLQHSGHMPHKEEPEALVAAVNDFLI